MKTRIAIIVASFMATLLILKVSLFKGCEISEDLCLFQRTVAKIAMIIATVLLILRNKGFRLKSIFRFNAIWIPATIILQILAVYQMQQSGILEGISNSTHISFYVNCMVTGTFEEFLCRVLIFGLVFCLLNNRKGSKNYFLATIYTSIIFGLFHTGNILISYFNLISTLNQIIFAIGIGFFLQAIFLRSGNVLLVIVLHGLVNYAGSYRTMFLEENLVAPSSLDMSISEMFYQVYPITIVSMVFVLLGYFLIRKREDLLVPNCC